MNICSNFGGCICVSALLGKLHCSHWLTLTITFCGIMLQENLSSNCCYKLKVKWLNATEEMRTQKGINFRGLIILPTMSLIQIKLSYIKLDMEPSTPYICIHINYKSSLCSCTTIDRAPVRSPRYQRTKANMSQREGFFLTAVFLRDMHPPNLMFNCSYLWFMSVKIPMS